MLGVCYYPEHWSATEWARDAARMVEIGITYVRIGEFAWSRIEPWRDAFHWDWLDAAVDTLGHAGLQLVMGTPTATPPKWLIDEHPDILARDHHGRERRFGSRRHYCFSSPSWHRESKRIVDIVAERYGQHPAIVGWQIDNEYGCHDTVLSYAPHCVDAFQAWLEARYHNIDALNEAWGTVFWSQEYRSFNEVGLPHLTVTEANPAHSYDYQCFSSDQVVAYHQMQAEIVRTHAPGRFITHNFMGFFTAFNHFAVGKELDLASWDSYPLGFTAQMMELDPEERVRYARTGHPDVAALHHDLYRSVGGGRFWVMEQQPGPVNWAPYNPIPASGMVRLWTWEALAHGAEVVCYFRWRQMHQAQEQMHAGLLRPDSAVAPGFQEAAQVAQELRALNDESSAETTYWRQDIGGQRADVALIFDYDAAWVLEIQPHGCIPRYFTLIQRFYTALRRLGVDVDVRRPGEPLDGYAVVLAPTLPILSETAWQAIEASSATVLMGPRSGSRERNFSIPNPMPPGRLQRALPIKVAAVDTVPPDMAGDVIWQGKHYPAGPWREQIESNLAPTAHFDHGGGAIYARDRWHYLAFWPCVELLMDYVEPLLAGRGLRSVWLPPTLRLRNRGPYTFAFNTGNDPVTAPAPPGASFVIGQRRIPPCDFAMWRCNDEDSGAWAQVDDDSDDNLLSADPNYSHLDDPDTKT